MVKKLSVILSVVLLASMVLTACGPTETQGPVAPVKETVIIGGTPQVVYVTVPPVVEPTTAVGRANVVRQATGQGDVPSLDPSLGTDTTSIQIINELTIGVVNLNETTLAIEPGMAKTWDISADGLVYTMQLMDNVPWVRWNGTAIEQVLDCEGNPRMVTANDFVYGVRRTCDAATASDYAYVLDFALVGCGDYLTMPATATVTQTAALQEGVGAKAIDDYTLDLTFKQPAAYNLNIAGMWIAHAEPSWIIEGDDCTEARGERWTEPGFNQSYGPFALKEWIHDSSLTIARNPFWPGTEAVPLPKIDEVQFTMLAESAALAEYEAGNLESVGVPGTDIDRVKTDEVLSKEFYQGFNGCTYYLGFNTSKEPVNNVHLRRALSMAVDRQSLIDNVLKGGQLPAQWFCRPGMVACPVPENNPDVGIKSDPVKAQEEFQAYLTEMGYTSADQVPEIVYMYNTSEGHARIAQAVQEMWSKTLGINVTLTNQEWAVYLKTIKGVDTPQVYRLGWCLDYPDANNWAPEVFRVGGSANSDADADGVPDGGISWKNDTFEQLINDAAIEMDPAKRLEMYIQVENILVYEDAAIIPVYWYTRNTLTKPYVQRTYSLTGHEAYEKWEILP